MKQSISPVVAAVIIVVVLVVAGLLIWRGTSKSAGDSAQIEESIKRGVAGGPLSPGAPKLPPGVMPNPSGTGPGIVPGAGPGTVGIGAPPGVTPGATVPGPPPGANTGR